MTRPNERNETETRFLSVEDAEIVDGPGVIADKVSGAMRDADRFGLPHVKPPLSEALERIGQAGAPGEAAASESAKQDALAGTPAEVDEKAGSAEMLEPDAAAPPS